MKLGNRNTEVSKLLFDLLDWGSEESNGSVFYLVFDKARLVDGVLIAFEGSLTQSSVVCRREQIFFDNVRRSVKEFHFWGLFDFNPEDSSVWWYRSAQVGDSRAREWGFTLSIDSAFLVKETFGIDFFDDHTLALQVVAYLLLDSFFEWFGLYFARHSAKSEKSYCARAEP